MEEQKEPLISRSNLPVPGSRLRPPSKMKPPSVLKPPSTIPCSLKRKSSPEKSPEGKKARLDLNISTVSCPPTTSRRIPGVVNPSRTMQPPVRPGGLVRHTSRTGLPPRQPAAPSVAKPVTRNGPGTRSAVNGKTNVTAKKPGTVPKAAPGKKRAAWDLKGRLQDMEQTMHQHLQQNSNLQSQVVGQSSQLTQLQSENMFIQQTAAQKEQLNMQLQERVQALEMKLRASEDDVDECKRRYNRQIEDLEYSKSKLERHQAELEGELDAGRKEISGYKSTVASMTAAQAGITADLSNTKLCLEQETDTRKQRDSTIVELKETIASLNATIAGMKNKIDEQDKMRKQLHNTIQELKGNIRVFCRVRPLIGEETLGNDGTIQHMHYPDEEQKILELERLSNIDCNESVTALKKCGNKYEFQFDRVFRPESTQEEVFDEISQLVQSALDGYNVCIFAYGQTGSGKTYTMEGEANNLGMIPKSVAQVFATATEMGDKGWKYNFEASILEIYNETIQDLLGEDGKVEDGKHEIKMVSANSCEIYVSGLTTVNVDHEEQLYKLLAKASENRAVGETKCNERSSRSHCVFRLRMQGHNEKTDEKCDGILNLIDLAGSERLKESGAQGARMKETLCINKSLSNLGNVIMALANKSSHIPYRNSKLTHLLQNCLGGSSKTLMFVNISPKEECVGESLNSLRFATKVNNCNIGTAQKKVK